MGGFYSLKKNYNHLKQNKMEKAISLAESNLANTESKVSQLEELDSIVIPTDILPEEKKEQLSKNVIFKLVKRKRGRTYLDNCADSVPNPNNKNTPERIWYLNGARSIWDSELEYLLKDKSRYERARRGMDIIFLDGVLRVKDSNVLLLEFLRKNPRNVGKKRSGAGFLDFYEYDPAEESKLRMAKQLLKMEMIIKAKELPIEKVRKLASFFGIPMVDDLGMSKTDDGVRTELMLKADTDPVTFQKYIDSKEVEISYLVKRAIIDHKIDLGGESGVVTWAQGHGFIAKVPPSRKAYEYLTELAMTNSEEGRKFKGELETMIV